MNKLGIRSVAPAAALLLTLACGGGDDDANGETTSGGETAEGEHHHHGEHGEHGEHADASHEHQMSPAQMRFHDLFAEIWHSEEGVDRAVRACGASSEIQTLGQAAAASVVEGREAPEGDAEAMQVWDEDQGLQTDMAQATRLLITEACGAGEEGQAHTDAEYFTEDHLGLVQQQLSRIHDVFHHAMERWQATHGE
ncbi:MAG: hypothetical protein R3B82_05990 [Sandaracinaceae bacterium]